MSGQVVKPQFQSDLRQINFPDNAKEVLKKIDDYYVACKSGGIPWNPETLIEEINLSVYNLVKAQDLRATKLRAVHKLCLADILVEYFSMPRDDNDRFALFRTIFYSMNFQKGDVPLEILGLMASVAVAFQNIALLDTLALWMTTVGLENPSVNFIAMQLSNDFVNDEFPDKYDYLPQKAHRFTAVLLFAIGKAYKNASPPKQLIIQVATWIESTPNVCLMAPHLSIFDLFRWCVCLQTFQGNNLEKSRLHLALISAINREGKGTQCQALPEVMNLIHELRLKRESLTRSNYHGAVVPLETLETVVDRLVQLIQMFISVECLSFKEMRSVFDALEGSRLPRTKLYDLLKSHHLKPLFYTFREPKQ